MTFADFEIDVPPGRTTGQVYTKCPKCSQDRKKKNIKCLGVNLDLGVWHCNHCGWKGTINDRKYERPKWENKTDLPSAIVEWFLKRNITQTVLEEMKISFANIFMPQCNAERKVMCFNYFRNGELINIKYRDSEKNFRMHKNAELILYNLDGIAGQEIIYITEGECDALVMIQSGFKSTCSVPNGASKNNNNLEYLDNCWRAFDNAKQVYLMTDTDEPGNKLADELARRIGMERCYRIRFDEFKDINEVLNTGIKISQDWINEHARIYPLVGVYEADTFWDDLLSVRKNGFPKGFQLRPPLDKYIQIHPGFQTIITGIPTHGKSEYLDFILLQLGVDHKLKGAFFTPENMPTHMHLMKITEKLLGKRFWDMSNDEINSLRGWITDHLFWINPDDGYDLKNILEHTRMCVLRYGINWYVIDPWNKLEHSRPNGMSETEYVSYALDQMDNFNKKNGVHGFLVAHPTKMDKDIKGNYVIPNLYSISGSAHFFNKSAIGITVYKSGPGQTQVHIQKVKFKYWGEVGMIDYLWDDKNGRYYTVNPDRTNWLQGKEQPNLIDFSESRRQNYEDNDDVPF